MAFLAQILAATLDPFRFVVCLLICAFIKPAKVAIPIAAIASSLVIETLLTQNQLARSWGDGFPHGLIASVISASVAYGLVLLGRRMFKR